MPNGPDVQLPGHFGGSIESLNGVTVQQISHGREVTQ
jgi:hypothetical protein